MPPVPATSASGNERPVRWWSTAGRRAAKKDGICAQCGEPFHIKPSLVAKGKGRYCSKPCSDQAARGRVSPFKGITRSTGIAKIYAGCGVEFRHRRSRIRYCSVACHHKHVTRKPEIGRRQLMKTGYIRIRLADGRLETEHRAVWEAAHGPIPKGVVVHHLNGDRTDNRLENLQALTHAQHAAAHATERRAARA